MALSKLKGAKLIVEGIMCLGHGVEFLISAGSAEQRRDSACAGRGSAALIWVTGLRGTAITPHPPRPPAANQTKVVLLRLEERG